jgi:AcrR family transcriptional regulator
MSNRPIGTGRESSAQTRSPSRAAWNGNPPQAAAARQRLLEAAARCIGRVGSTATSVAAVAAEAGVSRQTVYRYFASRDELTGRALRAAAEGLRAKLDRSIAALTEPADMIVESVVLGIAEVLSDPVLRAMSDSSRLDGSLLAKITQPVGIAWAREALAPAIEAAGWSEAEADARLELILRMFLSLIVSPSPARASEEMRAFLHRHLVPGLGLDVTEKI